MRHNLGLWIIWNMVLIGLWFVAAQCSSPPNMPIAQEVKATASPTETQTPQTPVTPILNLIENSPPQITGFVLPPDSVLTDAEINIQVNVDRNGHKIKDYQWTTSAGKASIIKGNGTTIITFQAPQSPGSYEVRVTLIYEGGSPVEDSTMVEVVLPPTPTPTHTSTSTPTFTPSPTHTPSATPTSNIRYIDKDINLREGPGENYPIIEFLFAKTGVEIIGRIVSGDWFHVDPTTSDEGWISALAFQTPVVLTAIQIETPPPTPTPTLTPTLAPTPKLVEPENGFNSPGTRPGLTWEWGDIILSENYYYEVKIFLEDQSDPIDVAWLQIPCYRYDDVSEGKKDQTWKFYWEVAVVQGTHGTPKQWSPVNMCSQQWSNDIEVWDPGLITETIRISGVSEHRQVTVIVEPPATPGVPPGGDNDNNGGGGGGGGGSGGGDD